MKNAVIKIWKFSPKSVEYKTFAQTQEIVKARDKNYAILMYNKINIGTGFIAAFASSGKNFINRYDPQLYNIRTQKVSGASSKDNFTFNELMTDRREDLGLLQIHFPEMGMAMLNFPMFFVDPGEEDIYFAVSQLQNYCDFKTSGKKTGFLDSYYQSNAKEYGDRINTKTLYIFQGNIDKYLTADIVKDYLVANYPGKVEIVDANTYHDVIMQNKENAAYLMIVPNMIGGSIDKITDPKNKNLQRAIYVHYIVDAQDGQIIGYSDRGYTVSIETAHPVLDALFLGVLYEGNYNATIRVDNLKDYSLKRQVEIKK